jgi:CCR4-NOT transcription complex subunit 7/8
MASGLVCNPDFKWIVFHGSFDFGYFMKLVSGEELP